MLRAINRPTLLAYFDAIKTLRVRQLSLILKAGYDPNLLINARGQNGLQFMINFFNGTEAHFRLQAPINKAAYISIAKLLLDSGLDPNLADLLTGETVIFDAIRFNDREMVALLLDYVDFSLRNKNGETALMCAARFGSKQVIRVILDHLRHLEMDGYFLRQRNRFGLTALEMARAENLDCAKVLTKHLIAFGNHADSVLARSTSHHQLMSRPLHSYMNLAARGTAAGLLDDPVSDYDSDILAFPTTSAASRATGGLRQRTGFKQTVGYYDPKAAEFNQYLLSQQELGSYEQQAAGAFIGNASSDEDLEFGFASNGGLGGQSSGGLVRSKSCILGPSSNKQKKFGAENVGGGKRRGSGCVEGTSGGNKTGSSWETSTGGR